MSLSCNKLEEKKSSNWAKKGESLKGKESSNIVVQQFKLSVFPLL